jgi:hypothetical protein
MIAASEQYLRLCRVGVFSKRNIRAQNPGSEGCAGVPTYRLYYLDLDAHISVPPEVIDAADDNEAALKAKQYLDGKDIEVWRENVRVAKLLVGRN